MTDDGTIGDTSREHQIAALFATFARVVCGGKVRGLDCEPSTRQRVCFANDTSHLERVHPRYDHSRGMRSV